MDCCKQKSTGVSSNFFEATLRALNHESKKRHRSSKSAREVWIQLANMGAFKDYQCNLWLQGCHFARTTKERQCSVCTGTVVFPLEMEINPWCCIEFDQLIGTFKQADYCSCRLVRHTTRLEHHFTTEGKLPSPLWCFARDFPQSHQPCCHHPPSLLGSNGRQCNASCSRSHQRNQPSDDIHQFLTSFICICQGYQQCKHKRQLHRPQRKLGVDWNQTDWHLN